MHATSPRRSTTGFVTALVLIAPLTAHACWDTAAARYGVSPSLLYAIAQTESALDPMAVGYNSDGSRDIGLMQINSAWLPTLATRGIGEQDLLEPCTNIQVGAWILASNVQRLGYTWDAVGAYHSASPIRRRAYATRVYRQLASLQAASSAADLRVATSSTATLPR